MHRSSAPLLLLCAWGASAFYLPGVAPREYQDGERVEVKVNKLTSTVTQVCQRTDAAMRCTQRPRSVAAPVSMAA